MQHQERHRGRASSAIEPLEGRLLLADTMVGIKVKKPDASETDPTRAGLGQFTVLRTGSTAAPLERSLPSAVTVNGWGNFIPLSVAK